MYSCCGCYVVVSKWEGTRYLSLSRGISPITTDTTHSDSSYEPNVTRLADPLYPSSSCYLWRSLIGWCEVFEKSGVRVQKFIGSRDLQVDDEPDFWFNFRALRRYPQVIALFQQLDYRRKFDNRLIKKVVLPVDDTGLSYCPRLITDGITDYVVASPVRISVVAENKPRPFFSPNLLTCPVPEEPDEDNIAPTVDLGSRRTITFGGAKP